MAEDKEPWIDPDDAPELMDEDFDRAAIYMGDELIRPHADPAAQRRIDAALRKTRGS